MSILSANRIFYEALKRVPGADINLLHSEAYSLMLSNRRKYYERKVDAFLRNLDLPQEVKNKLRKKLLQPVKVGGVEYSNFMEEAARRVSQSFQTTSGRIAELCGLPPILVPLRMRQFLLSPWLNHSSYCCSRSTAWQTQLGSGS